MPRREENVKMPVKEVLSLVLTRFHVLAILDFAKPCINACLFFLLIKVIIF